MIDGDMGATQTAAPRREPLRRDSAHRIVGGVCAGIGRHLRIDPLIVRIVFVAAATAGGVGIVLYGLAWVLVPVDDSAPEGTPRVVVDGDVGIGALIVHHDEHERWASGPGNKACT